MSKQMTQENAGLFVSYCINCKYFNRIFHKYSFARSNNNLSCSFQIKVMPYNNKNKSGLLFQSAFFSIFQFKYFTRISEFTSKGT